MTEFGELTVDFKWVGTSFPDGSGSARLILDIATLFKRKKIQLKDKA